MKPNRRAALFELLQKLYWEKAKASSKLLNAEIAKLDAALKSKNALAEYWSEQSSALSLAGQSRQAASLANAKDFLRKVETALEAEELKIAALQNSIDLLRKSAASFALEKRKYENLAERELENACKELSAQIKKIEEQISSDLSAGRR